MEQKIIGCWIVSVLGFLAAASTGFAMDPCAPPAEAILAEIGDLKAGRIADSLGVTDGYFDTVLNQLEHCELDTEVLEQERGRFRAAQEKDRLELIAQRLTDALGPDGSKRFSGALKVLKSCEEERAFMSSLFAEVYSKDYRDGYYRGYRSGYVQCGHFRNNAHLDQK